MRCWHGRSVSSRTRVRCSEVIYISELIFTFPSLGSYLSVLFDWNRFGHLVEKGFFWQQKHNSQHTILLKHHYNILPCPRLNGKLGIYLRLDDWIVGISLNARSGWLDRLLGVTGHLPYVDPCMLILNTPTRPVSTRVRADLIVAFKIVTGLLNVDNYKVGTVAGESVFVAEGRQILKKRLLRPPAVLLLLTVSSFKWTLISRTLYLPPLFSFHS